jgi:general nucleoside transport system permease protein
VEQIARIILSTDFIFSIIRLSTPILFATMAVLISDRAGVINIGVEGTMLFAALMGVIGSAYSGNVWIGVLVAVLSGMLFSGIIAYFHLKLETDIVLTGIAINLMASGLTIFILYLLTGDKGVSTGLNSKTVPNINIPVIKSIPVLGEMLSGHSVLTYLAFLIIIVIAVFLKRTRLGTYIRAAGENADSIETAGISVKIVRLKALLISGAIAGLGGAFMSMSYVSMFTKDMVAGRGFIALAAEAMGQGNPIMSMLSALFFGAMDALSNNLQLFNFPSELTRLLPYALTIIALAFYAARIKRQLKK